MKKHELEAQIKEGTTVPFIGMGVFKGTKTEDGFQIPFDSDSMILALNSGRAMSPRLMYEYSRAAMSLEQRKGRAYIEGMTNHIFTAKPYAMPEVYVWLKTLMPRYVVDLNLDDSLLKLYDATEHFLITGVSRIMAGYDRFIVYRYDVATQTYTRVDKEALHVQIPIVFKPLGCTVPEKNFIISDADFVDWLTEAMGGYALPPLLKTYKNDKSYLFLGVDFDRDTFRMVANEITLGLKGGYTINDQETMRKKEEKFLKAHRVEKLPVSLETFLKSAE
ncbi:SIR2 family protein [Sulfurospirillum sp. hDNRA2]|uniref:SIR2 family protein n=1 Tax=Sulfurospirillum sp. hDNRA2 TaxID=3237298 RepID=UPI0020B69112|nr:SIR2 family protein [Sulfurospirillum sp. DNRA8]MCR1810219.1 SIR2 family protein [Sulfurospirillum sp. DNRA8]